MNESPPEHTQIVVIGGGIMGCSTAYHLTKNGCCDVMLLERAKLTSAPHMALGGTSSAASFYRKPHATRAAQR